MGPDTPLINPRTGQQQETWGAQDPCVYEPAKPSNAEAPDDCLDSGLIFGGAFPSESNLLALSDLARARSWTISPSLDVIKAAVREAGGPSKAVISIYFRNPYVLDEESGVRAAGALLATFGVSDRAQMDVISGRARPEGRLPFALPATRDAIGKQHSDAPGYSEVKGGTLYPLGFGRSYE